MPVLSRGLAASLLCLIPAGCSVPVAVSLDEAEARRVVELLEQGGVAAESRLAADGRGQVTEVGRTDAERALGILAAGPARSGSPTTLDAFADPGVVPSRLAERARLASGVAGDLERTLAHMDGVVLARVHVSLPETSPLIADRPNAARASVLIVHEAARPTMAPEDVQRIVAGAVTSLAPSDVTVVMHPREPRPASQVDLARLGPFTTTRQGLAAARVGVVVVVACNLLLLALMFVLWRRASRRRAAPAASEDA